MILPKNPAIPFGEFLNVVTIYKDSPTLNTFPVSKKMDISIKFTLVFTISLLFQ